MVERPKSAMQARRSLLTSIFALVDGWGVGRGMSFGRYRTHPFQIPVHHAEVVHVLQTIRNASQLNGISGMPLRNQLATYKLGAVDMPIPLNECVDVSVFHPLGNESEPVFIQCHPK